jgi:hypothetical protein
MKYLALVLTSFWLGCGTVTALQPRPPDVRPEGIERPDFPPPAMLKRFLHEAPPVLRKQLPIRDIIFTAKATNLTAPPQNALRGIYTLWQSETDQRCVIYLDR